jgi:hypothetical protein
MRSTKRLSSWLLSQTKGLVKRLDQVAAGSKIAPEGLGSPLPSPSETATSLSWRSYPADHTAAK